MRCRGPKYPTVHGASTPHPPKQEHGCSQAMAGLEDREGHGDVRDQGKSRPPGALLHPERLRWDPRLRGWQQPDLHPPAGWDEQRGQDGTAEVHRDAGRGCGQLGGARTSTCGGAGRARSQPEGPPAAPPGRTPPASLRSRSPRRSRLLPVPQPPALPTARYPRPCSLPCCRSHSTAGAPRAGTGGAGREKEGPGLTVEVPVVVVPPLPTRRRRCAPGPARAAPLYRGGAGTARSPRGPRPAPAPAPPAPPPAPAPAPAPAPPATPGNPLRTGSTWHRPQPRTAGVMTGTGSTGGTGITGISGTSAAPALAPSRASRHSCCTGSTGGGSGAAPERASPSPGTGIRHHGHRQSRRQGPAPPSPPAPLLGPLS